MRLITVPSIKAFNNLKIQRLESTLIPVLTLLKSHIILNKASSKRAKG
jgi:hypothetical protein